MIPGMSRSAIWPVHCVAETWGAPLHPDLRVPPGATMLRKGIHGEDGYSGFSVRDPTTRVAGHTDLDAALRSRGEAPAVPHPSHHVARP